MSDYQRITSRILILSFYAPLLWSWFLCDNEAKFINHPRSVIHGAMLNMNGGDPPSPSPRLPTTARTLATLCAPTGSILVRAQGGDRLRRGIRTIPLEQLQEGMSRTNGVCSGCVGSESIMDRWWLDGHHLAHRTGWRSAAIPVSACGGARSTVQVSVGPEGSNEAERLQLTKASPAVWI